MIARTSGGRAGVWIGMDVVTESGKSTQSFLYWLDNRNRSPNFHSSFPTPCLATASIKSQRIQWETANLASRWLHLWMAVVDRIPGFEVAAWKEKCYGWYGDLGWLRWLIFQRQIIFSYSSNYDFQTESSAIGQNTNETDDGGGPCDKDIQQMMVMMTGC